MCFLFAQFIPHDTAFICASILPLFLNSFPITLEFQPHMIFISYFSEFPRIVLISDLPTESMQHASSTMDFWPFDIFWNAAAYMVWMLFSTVLPSFLAEHKSSWSQQPHSVCPVPEAQESGCSFVLFLLEEYFLLHVHSKAYLPLYHWQSSTLFHSLALPKAISFPNHQIIFMHSNLWTIIEISHFKSREAK